MADTKISALPSGASGVALTDAFPIARASANFKLTLQDVCNLIGPATTTYPNVPYTFPQFAATTASIASLTTSTNLTLSSTLTANSSVGSAAQILASRGPGLSPNWVNPFPVGGIIMWSGLLSAIPSGWYLCDGTNGTPDLRNKFIIGAYQDSVVSALNRPTTTLTGLVGTITTLGVYTASGTYSSVQGSITAAGNYTDNYSNQIWNTAFGVPLTTVTGTGSGGKATLTFGNTGGATGILRVDIPADPSYVGTGYKAGSVLSFANSSINFGWGCVGSGFQFTVSSVTYNNVALTGGSGTGATANITVGSSGVSSVVIVSSGTGYAVGDVLSSSSIGTATTPFQFTITAVGTYTGGDKDSYLISHEHGIPDYGHGHHIYASGNNTSYGRQGTGSGPSDTVAQSAASNANMPVTSPVGSVTSGTNRNLPPYYALALIMKAAY